MKSKSTVAAALLAALTLSACTSADAQHFSDALVVGLTGAALIYQQTHPQPVYAGPGEMYCTPTIVGAESPSYYCQ
jgi:hypothetical protein